MTTSSRVAGDATSPGSDGEAFFPRSAGDALFPRSTGDAPPGSTSTIVAGSVSSSHLHKIVDYSRIKLVPNGKQVESRPFLVGGRTWRLRYYPRGATPTLIEYASLFIKIDDTLAEDETVGARIKLSLLDQDGNLVPSGTHISTCHSFSKDCRSFGFCKFVRISELEKHLKDDSFTIQVDVTFDNGFYVKSILVAPSNMRLHFGDLLSTKEGADVEFRVGEETFWAHRVVLAARSPVFRAQLFGKMNKGTTIEAICVDGMEAKVFDALLTYMYTDALPDIDQQEESGMAQHLLVAAFRYDLKRLRLICENKLCRLINTSSVATIMALAEQHQCHRLKAECVRFLNDS